MKTIALRCLYEVLLLVGICSISKAQVILNRQVVAASGGSNIVNDLRIQYTVGEVAIMPITDGRILFTQGFQQPEELSRLPAGANPVKNYILFPNPAVSQTKIQFDLLANATITIEVINPAGQIQYHQFLEMGAGKSTVVLPVNQFAAGIYTVMLKVNANVYFEKLIVQ